MTTDTIPLMKALRDVVDDRQAAGLRHLTRYLSPLPTVTPPAGTLRADGRDVHGEFALRDGRLAVTVDSWSSQASRMEAALETIADETCYPLVRFLDDNGNLLTTTARLSHRHADATWRAARTELEAAGVPFQEIQDATVSNAGALLRWMPHAVLFGWWHSHIKRTDPKETATRRTERLKAFHGDESIADAFEGYARMGSDSRSARLVTSEILAKGVARRLRMSAKSDSLFGPLKGGEHGETGKSTGPSAVGLGSLPPVMESKAPVDVTFDTIEGTWFLSLAGLRRFHFGDVDSIGARALFTALALLLHDEAQHATRLRAGTELIVDPDHSHAEIMRHATASQPWAPTVRSDLIEVVTSLGARAGWEGPLDVSIPQGSVLAKLLTQAQDAATES